MDAILSEISRLPTHLRFGRVSAVQGLLIEATGIERLSSVGDTVSMMPPTVVLIIQDISELEVHGRVPEMMLAKLQPGSPIRVRFPAVKQERTVKIERISPSVDPMTRTIEVVALVPNEDRSLKAGMLVELDFSDAAKGEAAPIPSASARVAAEPKAPTP